MRPLRLLLDGFGSYRQPADADFCDVDFFALVGPTGSGKSTLIDGLCFALYGTVPRWGKENAIAHALTPGANSCRVCLVFEAAGRRYTAVRALTRDSRGLVHTRQARLERLDPAVDASAPIADILAASVEQLAEGPDQVKVRVQEILGLSYEHFTQSVLLPQGRFASFLAATAADRQDLLVELLAFGVYARVGQLARERAKLAAGRLRAAVSERADLVLDSERAVAERLDTLTRLQGDVADRLAALTTLTGRAKDARAEASAAQRDTGDLAAIRTPALVAGLAQRIAGADQAVALREERAADADRAEARAEAARTKLPDKSALEAARAGYAERALLADRLRSEEADLAAKRSEEALRADELRRAERETAAAQAGLDAAQDAHAAAHLAATLEAGQPCPVCLQPVVSLPHHPVPADLDRARAAASAAAKAVDRAGAALTKAARAAAAAQGTLGATSARLAELTASLAELTAGLAEEEVAAALEAIAAADGVLAEARVSARRCRDELSSARRERDALGDAERLARAELGAARDAVVPLGAPAVDGLDLAAAWAALTGWAAERHGQSLARQRELSEAATAMEGQAAADRDAILELVTTAVAPLTDVARAPAVVAAALARTEADLAALRRDLERAARLDRDIAAHREEEQVATLLGNQLRATSFERWLCGEALDSLMTEASQTLMELSGGQYQLDRDEKNDLIVIDYQDAGSRRPVHTLSGGETFQASLALALALSRQVTGLSAGMRDLNSMFLDEGFGTLDENTLETVATTLERLATDSDRMIGVVTHVPALAERVPVRFVVSRSGGSSVIRKERS